MNTSTSWIVLMRVLPHAFARSACETHGAWFALSTFNIQFHSGEKSSIYATPR